MRRLILTVPVLLLAPACGSDPGDRGVSRDPPPAAAVVAPRERAERLPDRLRSLASELDAAAAGEPDRLLTAEAVTDQLLYAPRDVDWLATGYDLEARLRQLQAMADGLVARLRRGSTLAEVRPEVELLQVAVRDLQEQLAMEGGGAAPPPLDSLLAQDPLRDVGAASLRDVVPPRDTTAATAGPSGPSGVLGTPVQTDPDPSGGGR